MKTITLKPRIYLTLIFLFSLTVTLAQVGINTTDPKPGSMLDIESSNKGIFVPKVNIGGLSGIGPVTGVSNNPTDLAAAEGLLVYNTNTTTGPGFFYWDGTVWAPIGDGDGTDDWKRIGNAGTTAGTNFIGTTDTQPLRFKTANQDRLEITTNGKLQTFNNGNASLPAYSWYNDNDIGMYRATANQLGFSTDGTERVRVDETGNVGINSNNPSQRLQVNGNLRLEGAFMPGNVAGNTDQILLSKGTGNDPGWGPGFLNTGEIDNIGKYYVGPFNISAGYLELTVTDANMTPSSTIFVTLPGNLPADPNYGDLVITTEARNGEFRVHFANYTGYNLSNFQISYVAFYN